MIEPILITGAARSGTSMVAGVVSICGAFGGVMSGPTRYNEKGMFENALIRDHHVKPYLVSIGADPLGQNPLPVARDAPPQLGWRKGVIDVMKSQGYKGGPWFYKGAKMALVWPLWHQAFPKAKWIIVNRYMEDIVKSCLRTSFMRGYKDMAGWRGWLVHHYDCFREMKEAGLNIGHFWPDPTNHNLFEGLIEGLGLTWKEAEVKDFLEPALFRQKAVVA